MPINWSGIEMPQFGYRLRNVVDPFAKSFKNVSFGRFDPTEPLDEPDQQYNQPNQQMNFSQFYDQPGPAMSRYRQHLDTVPKSEDYTPSKWRRLGAILSGVSESMRGGKGYETARDINLDPYKQAYGRWDEQGAGLREAAGLESTESKNRAGYFQKMMEILMDQQDKQQQRQIGWANVGNASERNDISRKANESLADYRERMAGLTENRDRNTAGYQSRMAGAAETNARTGRQRADWEQSPSNMSRYAPLLSGMGSFINATKPREFAPSYSTGTDLMRIEQLAAKEVATLNPEFTEFFDPEIGDFDYSRMEPSDAARVRKAVTDTIPIIQRRTRR
jgi:hypothetical protein